MTAARAPWQWAAWVAITLLLLVAPFLIEALFGRAWVRITDVALLFIMLALGLNIVVGFAGLLDMGYIAFFAVGAYCYALLASPQQPASRPANSGPNLWSTPPPAASSSPPPAR